MKSEFTFQKTTFLLLLFCSLVLPGLLLGQNRQIFSRFEFERYPLTYAEIGPNATSVDPDAITDGQSIYMQANCISIKGFDLTVPTTGGIFDQPEMGMVFRFQRDEAFANFFNRGNTAFYIQAGILFIQYETVFNGVRIINGPFATGFTVPNDNTFREYEFVYKQTTGFAEVLIDGQTIWQNNGPNNRPLYWPPNDPVIIGEIMDGTCQGMGVLDYAYFYVPAGTIPALPVEFTHLEVREIPDGLQVEWGVTSETNNDYFTLERSLEGGAFEAVGIMDSDPALHGAGTYRLIDPSPLAGLLYYRVAQTDLDGTTTRSESVAYEYQPANKFALQCYPNPCQNSLHLKVSAEAAPLELRLYDLTGRVLTTQTYDQAVSNIEWDMSEHPRGTYLVHLLQGGRQTVQKVTKY